MAIVLIMAVFAFFIFIEDFVDIVVSGLSLIGNILLFYGQEKINFCNRF